MRFAVVPIGPRRLVWLAAALIAGIATLALVVGLNSRPAHANPGAVESLAGCTTNQLAANDDSYTADPVPLGFTINYFGTQYDSLYVNNNGNVTFDQPLATFTPDPILQSSVKIIAPFWADVDTRAPGSSVVTYGQTQYGGRMAFCVNWVNVGYYSTHDDKLNSFQLLLVDRSDTGAGDFDMIMNYDHVLWETGDVSGGVNGFGGTSARMGYSNGSSVSFEYPGSAVPGSFLDSSPTGLANNSRNSLINGRFIFEVRNGAPPAGGSVSGHVYRADTNAPLPGAIVALCTNTCNTTNSDSEGFYSMTGLPAGDYILYAFPPAGNDPIKTYQSEAFSVSATDVIANKDALLDVAQLPPAGTLFNPNPNPSQAIPWVAWSASTGMSESGPPGLGSIFVEVLQNGQAFTSFTLVETPPGSGAYVGTMPSLAPHHGSAKVRKHVGPNIEEFDIWIDPSGAVKTVGGDPIQGATVTLYRSDSASGPFAAVVTGDAVMSPVNRRNPDTTDVNGHFGWDVVAGFYKIRAEKAGCVDPGNSSQAYVESDVLTIPPPVTDLDLRLDCSGASVTPTPGSTQEVWGDVDCSGDIAPRDGQAILKNVLGQNALSQTQPCPAVGSQVTVDGVSQIWGDVDCSGDIAPRDGQAILKNVLGQNALSQTQPCPAVGSTVQVVG
jgi:hypothetical protein